MKNQLQAVFRSWGVRGAAKAYKPETRADAIAKLPTAPLRTRAGHLTKVLDEIDEQRSKALREMVKLARQRPRYKELRTIDGIGPVFAAYLVAFLGNAGRSRTRKQLWAYSALAVTTYDSGEYEVVHGAVKRKNRKTHTRGLVRAHNRHLKYVFKQIAMTLSRTKWRQEYLSLLERSKNPSNAQLTLARKLAAIVLHIAKTGDSIASAPTTQCLHRWGTEALGFGVSITGKLVGLFIEGSKTNQFRVYAAPDFNRRST